MKTDIQQSINSNVKPTLSFDGFYRSFYGSADAISLAALSELEHQANQVGLVFEPSYLTRHETKGKRLRYVDKKFQGKGIVYCDDKSSNGIDYHFLTFKTHKGGGLSTTFSAALKHQFANPIKSMHYKDDKYFSSRYIYTTN